MGQEGRGMPSDLTALSCSRSADTQKVLAGRAQ
jgi:hypothetical protein